MRTVPEEAYELYETLAGATSVEQIDVTLRAACVASSLRRVTMYAVGPVTRG